MMAVGEIMKAAAGGSAASSALEAKVMAVGEIMKAAAGSSAVGSAPEAEVMAVGEITKAIATIATPSRRRLLINRPSTAGSLAGEEDETRPLGEVLKASAARPAQEAEMMHAGDIAKAIAAIAAPSSAPRAVSTEGSMKEIPNLASFGDTDYRSYVGKDGSMRLCVNTKVLRKYQRRGKQRATQRMAKVMRLMGEAKGSPRAQEEIGSIFENKHATREVASHVLETGYSAGKGNLLTMQVEGVSYLASRSYVQNAGRHCDADGVPVAVTEIQREFSKDLSEETIALWCGRMENKIFSF